MKTYTAKPTPAAVRQALALLERIARRTPLEQAQQRMDTAKHRYTLAAQDALTGHPDAAQRATETLAELNQARRALREAQP